MSAGNQIGNALHELVTAQQYDDDLSALREQLETVDSIVNDFNRELSGYIGGLKFNEQEFFETEQRLNLINTLKSKYGATLEEIEKHLEKLEEKYDHITHFEENRAALLEQSKEKERGTGEGMSKINKSPEKICGSTVSEDGGSTERLEFSGRTVSDRIDRNRPIYSKWDG